MQGEGLADLAVQADSEVAALDLVDVDAGIGAENAERCNVPGGPVERIEMRVHRLAQVEIGDQAGAETRQVQSAAIPAARRIESQGGKCQQFLQQAMHAGFW